MKGWMRKTLKTLAWIGAVIVVFTIVGFFVAPPVIKAVLVKKLSQNLNRQVSIQQIKVNPYALSIAMKGLAIRDVGNKEMFVSLEGLYVRASMDSVFKRAIIITDLRLTRPYVRVIRNGDGSFNFSDIPAKQEKEKPKAPKDQKPLLFCLNNIVISGGSIDFWDGPKKVQHRIKEMNIGVPFISNIPYLTKIYVEPSFSADINGNPYELRGKTKPFAEPLEYSANSAASAPG